MRLAGNLSWLYRDLAWDQRFAAAARDGFRGVEILLPYEHPPEWYGQQLRANGLALALFNTPTGEGPGRLGWAAIPGAEKEFAHAFDRARAVAAATGGRTIHVMAGHVAAHPPGDAMATLQRNLGNALKLAEADGLVLTLEPLNRHDAPGYLYQQPPQVIEVLRAFDSPRLRLQFDFYHCMKEGLDLAATVRACAPFVGHAQIAGTGGRHEPDLGEHGLGDAVALLGALGYDGWLGCEYAPRTQAAEGLRWCEPLRAGGVLA